MASSPPAHIPSVIFATPPPPQMDPAPQSTQPIYTDMPFLPPSSSQWPVTSTHIHPSDSQMMMTPGQQLPFPSPPQGPAYFIAGQYWPATYVTSPQQYSFPAGSSGFFPGTGSDEYGSYAGGFYPTQPPFTPSVQAAPVIMGSAPQEQQPPSQNPPHVQTRRERKLIRIRDPNQGGRDVTEELMSGVCTGSAPLTPPQTTTSGGEETAGVHAHEENITDVETDTQLEMLRPLESPIEQPEDLHLLQPPSPQDPDRPAVSAAERYGRPTAEPDTSQLILRTHTAIFHAAPTPVLHATPAPLDQEEFPDPAVEMEVAVPPVALDTQENKQAPQSTSTEDNAPEEEFTPPSSPTEEEKEETVSPTFVESTLEEVRKPIKYDREFLLGLQFAPASLVHPEVLPPVSDVVLDKVNKTPLHQLDPSRPSGMEAGPDSTASLANVCGLSVGGGRGGGPGVGVGGGGPRRSQQTLWKEPKKIITLMSLSDDVLLSKAQNAWKPSVSRDLRGHGGEEIQEEQTKTQELLKRFRSILNKLTPQKFEKLMKQVRELTISSEESLKGVIDLLFEKAISEPNFSVTYANMCHRLMGVKLKSSGVSFHKLLLRRCQNEFEKNKDEDEFLEKKKNEMEAASEEEERQKMMEELQEARDRTRRRSLGNIKFIGELFKLRMVSQAIVHDCVVKLLKSEEEESLECLCKLLFTIGKDLDYEKAKPRMNQYFHQMEKIIKERKTTSRIRFMLQDVLDLRLNNWVPRRGDQGPKTIDQIHQEAELEEHREQMKVQQALVSKKEVGASPGGRMSGGGRGGRGKPRTAGREAPPQDDGWSTVPISKKSPVDVSHINRIIKRRVDWDNQLLAPGGKHTWGIWGKGCSGGISPKPEDADVKPGGHKSSGGLSRSSASRQPSTSGSPVDSNRRAAQRKSSSRERRQNPDRSDHGRQVVHCGSGDFFCKAAIRTDDRSSTERVRPTANVKRATAADPPPAESLTKPSLTEAALKKKSTATIEEFLHIKDMKEALLCVRDMNSSQLLSVFVRNGVELTLERSAADRKLMGRLLHHLIRTGTLPTQQFYKGLHEVLLSAEDMTIDVPFIWLYLAEVITPVLDEGGVTMGEVFREISKPLVPLGRAGVLLTHILSLLCAGMGREKVGTMWREAGLQWSDFLSEDEDVHRFVREKDQIPIN